MSACRQPDVVELTRELVRLETITANCSEKPALEKIAALLEEAGFTCDYSFYDAEHPQRASLVARLNPNDQSPALCFGGHIDTVPFGDAPWADDPLAATVRDGNIYGRGSADMKGGLAAYLAAAIGMADKLGGRNLVVHVYGGEEVGLIGSQYLAEHDAQLLGNIGAVVVAEPTSLKPQFGNKGVTWFELRAKGVTAHASMPEKGENALVKLLPTACRLKDYQPSFEHPYLGKSTVVLSVMQSGMNANSVPDAAFLRMDARTVVGQNTADLRAEIEAQADPGVSVDIIAETFPLWSDPAHPWCQRVMRIVEKVTGKTPTPESAIFGTDASSLRIALKDQPMIILGPGAQEVAHVTNEFVAIEELRQAQTMYEAIIADWYGLA